MKSFTPSDTVADEIPPMRPGRINVYSADDILRWGVERFFEVVGRKEPLKIPDLGFTDEENKAMDELLRQDRENSADGL